jgi:hypothetical protein
MTTKELIKYLRCADNYEVWDGRPVIEAADRLEELQAENERLNRKATANCDDWVDD